jgi:DNA-binding MarR family transcriptional regulator
VKEHIMDLSAYHINKSATMLKSYLDRLFRENEIPITAEQWAIMGILWSENKGLTAREIAPKALKEQSTISRHLSKLKKMDWIEEEAVANDRRYILLRPSNTANKYKSKIFKCVKQTLASAEKGISKKELESALNVLKQIQSNLEGI